MALKVLFYGNCQICCLGNTINLSPLTKIIPCFNDSDILEDTFKSIVEDADIIVTQPINDNYKEKFFLSTNYVIKNCKKSAKIFIIPSLHFDFYYPDLMYKIKENNTHESEPADYHYKCVIDNYEKGIHYIFGKYINNEAYKSYEELINTAENSIKELQRREDLMDNFVLVNSNVTLIKFSQFIEKNYRDKLLFYSMNHPVALCIQVIAERIKEHLGFGEINYNCDYLFESERGILFSCLQKCVNFDINMHKPHLSKYKLEKAEHIIAKYIDCYTT